MIFNSLEYLVFFAIVGPLYFLAPQRFRWGLLLAASLWFYMAWRTDYVILILASIALDYVCSNGMGRTENPGARRAYLIFSICGNLGLLFAFKYFNFFNASLRLLFHSYNLPYEIPMIDVLLPVGISFYTFQTMSYTIDVYRRKIHPERHLGYFAVFVSFFPQLVAGPIERASNLLPQLKQRHTLDFARISEGLQQALWGLFKKVVVADRLAAYVDAVYNNVPDHTGLQFVLATYFFAFQIYCDFSGYSDIAIGSAKIMGIRLSTNFAHPYFAKSTVDFWRRWHISLSSWLRDYLYISLGGNRRGVGRTYINISITMLLGGLWHGANWTFVLWGALQGCLLIASRLKQPYVAMLHEWLKLPAWIRKLLQVGLTFHLSCLSWVFFRANSISDALHILRNLFNVQDWYEWSAILSPQELVLCVATVCLLLALDRIDRIQPLHEYFSTKPATVRLAYTYGILFAVILFGIREAHVFIYFQF